MKIKVFTLLELLMVVTLLVILFSLLLPSFQRSKFLSQAVVSCANFKQIGVGSVIYNLNHRNDMAPGGTGTLYDIADYLSSSMGMNWSQTVLEAGNTGFGDGIHADMIPANDAKIWRCPADPAGRNRGIYLQRSYTVNAFHSADTEGATSYGVYNSTSWTPIKCTTITQPSVTLAMFEYATQVYLGEWSAALSWDPASRIGVSNSGTFPNHHQLQLRSPALFCDGAAKLIYYPSTGDNSSWIYRAVKP